MHQSGASNKAMGINPRSNRLIRSYFVEAAWQAIRTDSVIKAYYPTHLEKEDKKNIVKIAHKLISRTLEVIKQKLPM
ncbi:hypothetical protein APR41_10385 [Salegentibacter salinarum]|uniref:Transposase IS116/IS110/IS902 C-terminal domain-containing protein n=1 Tax=Salegentibacter salinarum TaxID=447422 RepID=A0A2N0TNC1_9FLAO|nr:IS110 family transposase [Salegentibacter salinarum]PKD16188.1 hypothetical protein APR41_10385 [Salegentibacter salinarum]